MAERLGIIEPQLCKLLLTTVAISMAATPALSNFSAWVADQVCVCVCVCLLRLVDKVNRAKMSTQQRNHTSLTV